MKYTAQKNQISAWLAKLAEQYIMLAPKQVAKSVNFSKYTAEEIVNANFDSLLDYTTKSAKDAYIPQAETLFTYKSTKKAEDLSKLDTVVSCEIEAHPTIIFGARPCDAKGVEVLDAAYLKGQYRDPYYAKRRENTVLIAQACSMALPTCFCNWTGTDLTSPYVADILFTAIDNSFVFEGITEKGKELLASASFAEASNDDTTKVEEAHTKAHASLSESPDLSKLPQIINYNFENKDFWSKVTSGCIGCNSCTFVCPTCQCFTITDEGNSLEGKRIRSWASCMGEEFTREASGHNPRSAGLMRWRNRLGHKFSYMTSWHKDLFSCTGCGRCLLSCPASISIKGMIAKMLADTPTDADLPPARIHYAVSGSQAPKAPKTAPAKAPVEKVAEVAVEAVAEASTQEKKAPQAAQKTAPKKAAAPKPRGAQQNKSKKKG